MTQTFKNLGIITKAAYPKTIKAGMDKLITIEYTQPGFSDPKKVWSMGAFDNKGLTEDVRVRLRALVIGDEVCVHTAKNEKGFNTLVDVTDKGDVPQKGSGGGFQKKGGWTGKPKGKDDGAQVGNALTNASSLLPEGSSADDLENMAWDIILVGERLKKRLGDHRDSPEAKATTYKTAPKDAPVPMQEELVDDDLDGMAW